MKKLELREMIIIALLITLSIIIPMICPKFVVIPPFTATLLAHLPIIVAMFISPLAVIFVALGSSIGFFFAFSIIVAARAATHMIFGLVGNYMMRKGRNYYVIFGVTAILHALAEAIVIIPLMSANIDAIKIAVYTTFIGTLVHYAVDYTLSTPVVIALRKMKFIKYDLNFKKKA